MIPSDLIRWRLAMGYSQAQAAEALGMSVRAIKYIEAGVTSRGRPLTDRDMLGLSQQCAALWHKIPPWPGNTP